MFYALRYIYVLCPGADAVIHLAAVPDDAPFLERLVPVNVVGLYRVIEACRQSVRAI